MINFKTLG